MSGGWERSIGATVLMEGLAVHTSRQLDPGLSEAAHIEYTPGWWRSAQRKKRVILTAILPVLSETRSDAVFRFTICIGPAGLEREAYAAGYWAVDQLRRDGMSLGQIARVPESKLPALAARAIRRTLARGRKPAVSASASQRR